MSASESPTLPAGVWFFSGDLIFAGRVRGAAEQADLAFSLLSRWPENPPSEPKWIVVDLATKFGAAAELCKSATLAYPGIPCLAFGPHVQAGRLSQARQAGFDPVMTRGQFDAALATIFTT